MSKNDFDNKLISFNIKITSNRTKYLEFQKKQKNKKKLNCLTTTDHKVTDYVLS